MPEKHRASSRGTVRVVPRASCFFRLNGLILNGEPFGCVMIWGGDSFPRSCRLCRRLWAAIWPASAGGFWRPALTAAPGLGGTRRGRLSPPQINPSHGTLFIRHPNRPRRRRLPDKPRQQQHRQHIRQRYDELHRNHTDNRKRNPLEPGSKGIGKGEQQAGSQRGIGAPLVMDPSRCPVVPELVSRGTRPR